MHSGLPALVQIATASLSSMSISTSLNLSSLSAIRWLKNTLIVRRWNSCSFRVIYFINIPKETVNVERIAMVYVLPTRAHVATVEKPLDSSLEVVRIYPLQPTPNSQPQTIKIFHESQRQGQIKKMAFSSLEPKFMCILAGDPHNKLIYIDTSRSKALAESNFNVKDIDRMTICPQNSHLICTSGGSSLKLFKVEQYAFKPLEEVKRLTKNRKITEHAWFGKKSLLVATDQCEILFLEETRPHQFEIKQQYHNVFNEAEIDSMFVSVICPFSKGFVIGSNNGKFCLWVNRDDSSGLTTPPKLELVRKWSTPEERASLVVEISVSVNEDILAIALANNDIATLSLNDMMPQTNDPSLDIGAKEVVFEYLYKGFHSGSITGLDICQQRPLVATCSRNDSTIRVWNYKNFGCKLLRMFYFKLKDSRDADKPLITLAFHPSGYYLAVGCIDKLRFFHVMNTELRPYREVPIKGAHIVKFSHAGDMIAAAFPSKDDPNIHHIKVLNALSLEEIGFFKDHDTGIRTLHWKPEDECLGSLSLNGILIERKTADWSKNVMIGPLKETVYDYFAYAATKNSVMLTGSRENRRFLEEQDCESNQKTVINVDVKVHRIVMLQDAAILTTQAGMLLLFSDFKTATVLQTRSDNIAKINHLVLSPCGRYLITADEEGVVLVYSIMEGIPQSQQAVLNSTVDEFLADVVLVYKKEVQKYIDRERQLKKIIGTLTLRLKAATDQSRKKHAARMQDVESQKKRLIEDAQYRIKRLQEQIGSLKQRDEESANNLNEATLKKVEGVEVSYEKKLEFQSEKFFQLEQEMIQARILHQNRLENIKKLEIEQIQAVKDEFRSKFKQSEQIYASSKAAIDDVSRTFDERLQQIETDQEEQIREIETKKSKFKIETAATLQEFHEKFQSLQKDLQNLNQDMNNEKSKFQEVTISKKKMEKQVNEAKERYEEMDRQYKDKIDALKGKESRIEEYENKLKDLQKKKHILSYKATQMKSAMEPKEAQISKLKNDLIRLKKEFEQSAQAKEKESLELQKSLKHQQYLEGLLKDEQQQTSIQQSQLDQVVSDIFTCINVAETSAKSETKLFEKQFVTLFHVRGERFGFKK